MSAPLHSVPDLDATDEAAVTTRMSGLIRNHGLSYIELVDEVDEEGLAQVRLFGHDSAIEAALADINEGSNQ